MKAIWYLYDGIAESYGRVSMPHYFAKPGRDLVSMLALSSGDWVLDVGTGAGAVACAAGEAVGAHGLAVGTDLSVSRLREARKNGLSRCVVGTLHGLPYSDDSFDAVTAAFVITHLTQCEDAVSEMVRVARPSARIGISSWARGPSNNAMGKAWKDLINSYADADILAERIKKVIPWEDRFTELEALEGALKMVGLESTSARHKEYSTNISTDDYAAGRANSFSSRFMKNNLTERKWCEFLEAAS